MPLVREKDIAELPKDEPRTKMLMASIKKEKGRADALIQILHTAQNLYGYLPMPVLRWVSRQLNIPPSRIFGVATFYHFFSLKPKGEHTCLVCTGTACYVKGAVEILKALQDRYGIGPGEVTKDNRLGVEMARCLGACGLAPAVVMDDVVMAKVNAPELIERVEERIGVKS